MNFDLLKNIISNDMADLPVNIYNNGVNGTLRLAERHIRNLDGCDSKRLSSSEIEFYYNNKLFGSMSGQTPSTSEKKAIRLCKNKMETEKLLIENNINTTESSLLNKDDYALGLDLLSRSDSPMVLKPYNMYAGKGITLNVTKSNFDFAWKLAQKEYSTTSKVFKVLLQPLLPGIEARVLVVEGIFNSAILRVPANVIGNGKSTIKELVNQKNKEKLTNPHLNRLPIKFTDEVYFNLENMTKNIDSIPKKEEVIFLHNSSNISLGGDSYEISHLIGKELVQLAERAIEVIPGINTAGVDIMFESLNDSNGSVLEINPGANLRMHHYPFKGEPKTPVNDLIDTLLLNYKKKRKI